MFWEFLCLVLVPMVSVFGNSLVLLVIRKEKALQSISNFIIASLALTDLLISVIAMPYSIYAQITDLSDPMSDRSTQVDQIFLVITFYLITASIYHLSSISVIRHIAISHPLEFRAIADSKKLAVILLVVWAVSFLPQIPLVIAISTYSENNTILECGISYKFDHSALYMTLIQVILSYVAPLFVMIASMQMSVRVLKVRAKVLPMTAIPCDDLSDHSQMQSRSRASSFANASIDGTASTTADHSGERRASEDPQQCETPLTRVAVTILRTSPDGVTYANECDNDNNEPNDPENLPALPSPKLIIKSKQDFSDGTHEMRTRHGSLQLDASPRFTIMDPELRALSRASVRSSSPISRRGGPRSRHGSLDVSPRHSSLDVSPSFTVRRRSLMDQLDQSFDRFKEMLSPNGYVEERRGSVILRQRRMSMMGAINMKDQRALKTLCIVFSCFLILYLPFFIVTLTSTLCAGCRMDCYVHAIVQWLAFLAPTLSPFLYMFFSKDIRKTLMKMFTKRKR